MEREAADRPSGVNTVRPTPHSEAPARWYAIVNPVAGNGRGMDELPAISRQLRDQGIAYELVFTEHKWHATELVVAAVRDGYRGIIVVGGDGTLHEVVNGLFIQQTVPATEVWVSVIAVGTGNDWIRMYGISSRPAEAVAALVDGSTLLQDVGVVSYEEATYRQQRYLANVAGVGLDAAVVRRFNRLKSQGKRGKGLYFWALARSLLRYRSTGVKVWVDDRRVINGMVLSAAIGVCKYNGGGMIQVPQAIADDGLLDVTTIRRVDKLRVIWNFRLLFNGRIHKVRSVDMFRGSRIRIESSPEAPLELDGELLGHTPVEFRILHRAIRVVVARRFLDEQQAAASSSETV